MNKSAQIRELAAAGLACADVARRVGVSYQFAYNVIRQSGPSFQVRRSSRPAAEVAATKPRLEVALAVERGFALVGHWDVNGDKLVLVGAPPKVAGVYAFAPDDTVQYVGLASISLSQRLGFYRTPGVSQRTNVRMNAELRARIAISGPVAIFTASPPDFEWNGLRVNGAEGLEAGIIKTYLLPWNVRGAN